MTRQRLAVVGLLAVAVLFGGWLVLRGDEGDERWGVLGTARDPEAVADACQDTAHGEVGYALTADAPPDPAMANVYATLSSRGLAVRVAACLRDQGVDNVEVSEAGPVGTFSPN